MEKPSQQHALRSGYGNLDAKRRSFSFRRRINSFRFAISGLRILIDSEHNSRIHAAATIAAVALGLALGLKREDWLWVCLAIGWVWTAEAFNTALERLADHVTSEPDPQIMVVKDLAASAVLISSVSAAVIGLMAFGPRLAAAL